MLQFVIAMQQQLMGKFIGNQKCPILCKLIWREMEKSLLIARCLFLSHACQSKQDLLVPRKQIFMIQVTIRQRAKDQ